ncbi:dihydrolipoamide acetyltransferase family protein [Micromonospora gifhornensis]|uniref:dihydrolipoamide acetyltransferase family protein n=1 Tax=Micromonospora gifhornensis TaxID=84594 RepID=UPI00364CEB46
MTAAGIRHFQLPDVGEGLVDATIVAWHVRPGDTVAVDQVVVEIETAKAVVELPCPFAGTVHELLAEEGETVAVGAPIIGVAVSAVSQKTTEPATASPDVGERLDVGEPAQASLVGFGATPNGQSVRKPPGRPVRGAGRPSTGDGDRAGVVRAKPPIRRLAKELGVELSTVTGSGPGGEITRDDVRRAGPARQPEREERIRVAGIRRRTATAMVDSAFTAPHATCWVQVDVTGGMAVLDELRGLPEFASVTVSPLLLAARALCVAIGRHPEINSSWQGDTDEIVIKRYVNLGIAAATRQGLIVPTVKEAQTLTLPELARTISDLTRLARAGQLTPRDVADGTITITNVGVFGMDGGTPILVPGQAAILALGQVRDLPWVYEGRIEIRKVTTLALSFDHRVVDGDLASAVLREVGQMLTNPARLLAWS